MRVIGGTQDRGGDKLNAQCKEEKKNYSVSQSTVTTHQKKKKKLTLGPQEQDRLKVIMNKYLFLLSQCSSSKFFQERVELKMIYMMK